MQSQQTACLQQNLAEGWPAARAHLSLANHTYHKPGYKIDSC